MFKKTILTFIVVSILMIITAPVALAYSIDLGAYTQLESEKIYNFTIHDTTGHKYYYPEHYNNYSTEIEFNKISFIISIEKSFLPNGWTDIENQIVINLVNNDTDDNEYNFTMFITGISEDITYYYIQFSMVMDYDYLFQLSVNDYILAIAYLNYHDSPVNAYVVEYEAVYFFASTSSDTYIDQTIDFPITLLIGFGFGIVAFITPTFLAIKRKNDDLDAKGFFIGFVVMIVAAAAAMAMFINS
jgi:hypothetical protein